MSRRRFFYTSALAALLFCAASLSPVLAFGVPAPHPSSSPGGSVVAQAGRTWSESEIMEMVEGSTASKVLTWGARIGYAGAIIGAASLIDLGLNWFYDQAQKSTGTSLDDWYRWQDMEVVTPWSHRTGLSACDDGDYMVITLWPDGQAYHTAVACTASDGEVEQYLESQAPDSYAGGSWEVGGKCDGGWTSLPVFCYLAPKDRPLLGDWLNNHSDAMSGMKDQVVPQYALHNTDDPNTYPQTFPHPFPGVSLDPPPNGNQWWDDPYYSPTTDTDGDGWPDWMEERLGSRPGNAGNYPDPNADPDGDGYTNDQERAAGTDPADPNSHPNSNSDPTTDTDGDGIADSADPCPTDPTNSCSYSDPSQEDDVKIPTDYARENTLQGAASTLSGMAASLSTLASRSQPTDYAKDATISALADQLSDISDTLAELNAKVKDDTSTATPGDVDQLTPDLGAWSPTAPTAAAWDSIKTSLTTSVSGLVTTASSRFPFGIASWFPSVPSVGGGDCPTFDVSLPNVTADGLDMQIAPCGNAFDTMMHDTARP